MTMKPNIPTLFLSWVLLGTLTGCGVLGNDKSSDGFAVRAVNTGGSQRQERQANEVTPDRSPQELNEQNRILHLQLVEKMLQQNVPYAALAHLDAYDKDWGANPQSMLLRADALRMTGQLDLAEQTYFKVLNSPVKAAALYGLAKISIQKSDWSTAQQRLVQSLAEQPLNSKAYADLGLVNILLNRMSDAKVALMKAQQLDSANTTAAANLVLFYMLSNDAANADRMARQLNWNDRTRQLTYDQARRIAQAHREGKPPTQATLAPM